MGSPATIKSILKKQIELLQPEARIEKELRTNVKTFTTALKEQLGNEQIVAEVFIGGSFAKKTLIKSDSYDIDIFVRFDWRYDDISDMLEPVLKKVSKQFGLQLKRLHGSRDYFTISMKDKPHYFEVIPVAKIRKPSEERNVTDLSYFHVPYVRRKVKGLEDELRLAKTFCQAQRVYGAETYVRGFSGYALECLIIHYKSFTKLLRELSKIKKGERHVIDIEKHFKRKKDVFFELNENKLQSPLIVVDPTYKDRNATASLSAQTFERFQQAAKAFLRKPSLDQFTLQAINVEKMKKTATRKKASFIELSLTTNRQAGDIAGTKLKKFSAFIVRELHRYFEIIDSAFEYPGETSASLYIVAKPKKEVVRIGPPLHLKKHVRAFKKEHMNTYEENKMIHAKIKVAFGLAEYVDVWKKSNKIVLKQMGITRMRVC